jgi:F-type H+-transporting ATPase subunit epsilon
MPLNVSVISPEKTLFEGSVGRSSRPRTTARSDSPGHAPMMTLLGKGTLRLGPDGAAGRFNVEGGFLQVVDDAVRVVTERAGRLTIRPRASRNGTQRGGAQYWRRLVLLAMLVRSNPT